MILPRRICFVALLSCLAALTSHCAPRAVQQEAPADMVRAEVLPEPACAEIEVAPPDAVKRRYAEISAAEIPREISRLLSTIQAEPGGRDAGMAHLELAWLYGHYRNPAPQYLRAQQELEAYIVLDPKNGAYDDLQNWYHMLGELARLQRENGDLRGKADQLRQQVEQLKHLDIEMEEKRQKIK